MQYDLVFEGGGAKGMVFVGALQELEAAGHTCDRLLGTSAGAITASLLAAGYTSQRMLEALHEEEQGKPIFASFMGVPEPFNDEEIQTSATVDFFRRLDIPFFPDRWEDRLDQKIAATLLRIDLLRHVFSFIERGGWFSASRFVEWMKQKLDTAADGARTGYADMTLAEFFAATQRELCLIASDTTAQRLLVLNHRTAPDCPLLMAIRMSMSIPLLWCEVEWQKSWGLYRDQDPTGHVIVDGGLLSNFPIELLVSNEPRVTHVMGDRKSHNVLGLLIDETLAVPEAPPKPEARGFQWGKLRTAQRFMALIDTMTTAHDKEVIAVFERLVARLPAKGYGTTEFAMSAARRDALVRAGRQAMKAYLATAAAPRVVARDLAPSGIMARDVPPSEEDLQAATADRIAIGILDRQSMLER